jgi:hypothetical protein
MVRLKEAGEVPSFLQYTGMVSPDEVALVE